MRLFPAIDLLDGEVVMLSQGNYDQKTAYSKNPVEIAKQIAHEGAEWVHIVDLNAARNDTHDNKAVISQIAKLDLLNIEVGGGMRSMSAIEKTLSCGVQRVIIGTALTKNPDFAKEAVDMYGDHVVAGIDARGGKVSVEGWSEDSNIDALTFVEDLRNIGFEHLVYTEIERDGMQRGLDMNLYKQVAKKATFPVVASGGVASIKDIEKVKKLGKNYIEGVIVGKAFYEGKLSIPDALQVLS